MISSHPKVLLIEDNPGDARLIQEALGETTDDSFDLETVATLTAGLQRLSAGGVDAVLLDLALPDSFGLQTFVRAKAQALGAAIIVLTGLNDETLALKLVQGGAQDFVAKVDVSGNNLTRAIRYAIERERLEQKFRKLNEELEQRIRERTEELEAANKELEAFSYSVSHDLRAPLNNIHGYSSLLVERYAPSMDDTGRKYLDNIKHGAVRMSALIDDLLTLAKVSRQGLHFRDVNLNVLVKETVKEFEGETADRQIEWRVGALPNVTCDYGLMRQVFMNLLSNAVKYTRRSLRPLIEIGFQTVDGKEAFVVRDNGVGFDMADASKVFAPFQRLHREKEFEGSGVGLATVERIIHKHAGTIWARSEQGLGTTFYFTIGSEAGKLPAESVVSAIAN